MSKNAARKTVRMPAGKFPHLQKRMAKARLPATKTILGRQRKARGRV